MTIKARRIQRGYGDEQRPVTKILWERDSRPPNVAMQAVGNHEPHNEQVDYKRYYDKEYAAREFDLVFRKHWLYAAREEDIPNVGDRVPFDVGPVSLIIVRAATDTFKAFYNSCLHRGTRLCGKPESGATIRCPYHAWEWNIDGRLKRIPSNWDFPSIGQTNSSLREVKLERWGGFIFVNCDPDSPPLEEALGVVPEHFKDFAPEKRYTAARYRRRVPANWKVAQEAFQESYHVFGTHPEGVPYNGDSQAQYDVWANKSGHVGRQVTPSSVPSMLAPAEATPLSAAVVYAQIMKAWHYPEAVLPAIDPEKNIRAQIADWHRDVQEQVYGRRPNEPDALLLDSTLYFVFPQSCFWLSESIPFTYSFTPHPTDPEQCYWDVRMLMPIPAGQERPPAAAVIEIGPDESIFERAPAFNFLAQVFDQDMSNMPLVQRGMHTSDPGLGHSQLGAYQESIIQHWAEVMDDIMGE